MQASTFDQQSLMLGHSQSMIMGDQSVAGSVFGDTSAAPSRAGSVRPLSPGKEMILNYSKCSQTPPLVCEYDCQHLKSSQFSLPAPSTSHSTRGGHHLNLDAPIQDDGFGGSMASTNQDILAGGLFEDGSLFDDAPASMPPSERQPESDFNDGPGDFGGPGERREKVEKSVQYSPHSIHQVHLEVCPAEEAGELHRRRWSRCQDHQHRHTTPSPPGYLATVKC